MLQRHPPTHNAPQQLRPKAHAAVRSRAGLWKCVRRDPRFLSRSTEALEHLARRLHGQAGRARLRWEQAQDLDLANLAAADQWWKQQWLQAGDGADIL